MTQRLSKEKFVAWASETTYGTDALPPAPTDWEQTIQCEIIDVREALPDEADRACASPGPADSTPSHNEVTVESYLFGKSGAAGTAPGIDALFKACGLQRTDDPGVSVAYTPYTDTDDMTVTPSATIKCWQKTTDGEVMLCTALGFRGNVTLIFQERQKARVRFEGRARYTKRANAAANTFPKPTAYSGNKRALVVTGITFEIGGTLFRARGIQFTTEWELVEDRDVTATTSIDEIHLRRPKAKAM